MWINIESEGLPDFRVFGFHTGYKMRVKIRNAIVDNCIYQGWGVWEQDFKGIKGVTEWEDTLTQVTEKANES